MDLIKSVDELDLGDVVDFEEHGPCIVGGIGDIPEHDKEVSLYPIYKPTISNNNLSYNRISLKEGDFQRNLQDLNITKLDKNQYFGWKYLAIKRV